MPTLRKLVALSIVLASIVAAATSSAPSAQPFIVDRRSSINELDAGGGHLGEENVFGNQTAPIEQHANWPRDTMAECGHSWADRIVGGRNATLGQYPWLARLGIRLNGKIRYDCGGSLVSRYHVLSAAHCVTGLGPKNRVEHVVLGENVAGVAIDCEDDVCADPPQLIAVRRIAFPLRYNRPPFANDVALLTLRQPANITEWVLPVCLPFGKALSEPLLAGQKAEVAGWGLTDADAEGSTDWLQTLTVPVHDTSVCRKVFGSAIQVGRNDEQLCVGGRMGEDSCSGDSGGPLVQVRNTKELNGARYFQYGIVSVGSRRCGETPTPALYANVRYYLRWIMEQMKSDGLPVKAVVPS